jgi:hypothetical protein
MNEQSTQELWQSQPVEGIKMSPEAIHRRAQKFERKIRWRNRREYVAGIIVCALFAYFMIGAQDVLFRVAYGLYIAGMVWVGVQLHRKGSVGSVPVAGSANSLQFFRTELERQRDAVKNVWPWYLAPLVPGFVVFTVAWAHASPHPAGVALFDGFVAVMFFGIWKMNQHAARCLQRMIDELNAAE